MFLRLLPGLALSVALASPALAQTSDIATGHALYNAHCSGCHLTSGAGGVHFSHAISSNLRAPGLEETYHNNPSLLVRAILYARDEDGDRLDSPMPAWKGVLSHKQALDIVAYLETLHG
ncbi:cytochrome c [Acidocella sp.]|jgi:mono/diheme cytochrome c family protein|uniref:c-type cytochrome n=1 Tax=Acidocella sp. TaxID=50710 RepID=UPI00262D4061|nr:cytochrome c [Acidocella sp.]